MSFSVFFSHSSQDYDLVKKLSDHIGVEGFNSIIAQDVRPRTHPQNLSDKVRELIMESDAVATIISKNGVNSNWVHQEIGFSLGKKPLIPFVEDGIPSTSLGFLQGAEYIPLYKDNLEKSISKFFEWTEHLKPVKAQPSAPDQNPDLSVLKAVGVLILGGIFIWALSKE